MCRPTRHCRYFPVVPSGLARSQDLQGFLRDSCCQRALACDGQSGAAGVFQQSLAGPPKARVRRNLCIACFTDTDVCVSATKHARQQALTDAMASRAPPGCSSSAQRARQKPELAAAHGCLQHRRVHFRHVPVPKRVGTAAVVATMFSAHRVFHVHALMALVFLYGAPLLST